MSDETLYTAARRAVRDYNIDMNRGGIITVQTQRSMETLHKMVTTEQAQMKRDGKAEPT